MSQDTNLDQIKKLLDSASYSLQKAQNMLSKVDSISGKSDYSNVPGVEGTFDGVNLVASDGTKYEVPANYAAKSRLVFGDTLKMIEQEGKTLFKQIAKVERKKCEGVLTKKEGKWYVITDNGSFRISDVAAEFNKVEINDQAIVLIPEQKTNSPYAALDKLLNKNLPNTPTVVSTVKEVEITRKQPEIQSIKTTDIKKPVKQTVRVESKPQAKKPAAKKPTSPSGFAGKAKEFVQNISSPISVKEPIGPSVDAVQKASSILEDDDLR